MLLSADSVNTTTHKKTDYKECVFISGNPSGRRFGIGGIFRGITPLLHAAKPAMRGVGSVIKSGAKNMASIGADAVVTGLVPALFEPLLERYKDFILPGYN